MIKLRIIKIKKNIFKQIYFIFEKKFIIIK